jgi:hypothetical protein
MTGQLGRFRRNPMSHEMVDIDNDETYGSVGHLLDVIAGVYRPVAERAIDSHAAGGHS